MNEVISEEISVLFKERIPCQVGFIQARLFEELRAPLTYSIEKGYDSGLIHASVEERINPLSHPSEMRRRSLLSLCLTRPVMKHWNTSDTLYPAVLGGQTTTSSFRTFCKRLARNLRNGTERRALPWRTTTCCMTVTWRCSLALDTMEKNTLLINDRYGSFFFIGSIVTDLTLDEYEYTKETPRDIWVEVAIGALRPVPRAPSVKSATWMRNDASPTFTQSKEEIPDFLLDKLRKFPFGCDFCQLACPYNQDITTDILYRFRPTGKERITPPRLSPTIESYV